mgnify:FL=1
MNELMDRFMNLLEKNKLVLWLLILLITVLWGYAWVIMKQSLTFMGPYTFSAFRFLTGTITLLLIVWFSKQHIPLKKYWKQLFIQGFLQTTVVFILVMFSLQFVGAGKSSVLLYSMPIWGSLLAAHFLKEKLSVTGIIGLILGFFGLLLIIGWDFLFETNQQLLIGQLLIIIAAIVWSISNIYFRLHLQHLPQTTTTAYQMLFGLIGLILAAIIFEWKEPLVINAYSIYYILFSGVIASALCFTVWFILLSLVDMMTATISSMLVPVFGLFFSSLILDEKLTINLILGSVIIISGIVVSQLKQKKPKKAEH